MGIGPSFHSRRKSFSIKEYKEGGPSICFDDFQILRAIGKGSFGKVCIVQKKDTMKMYAMKYVNKTQCIEKDAFKNVLKEIEILSTLEHPFLVNLWYTFQDEEDMFMVVDLLLGGDLRYHLQQGSSCFTEEQVSLYTCEIALALDYLGSKGILHRDIKPENILLDDTGHAHITDFNIATVIKDGKRATTVTGTKPYMAPEVVVCFQDYSDGYSFAADWWSLGVTMYEMFCKKRPYDIHSSTSLEEINDMLRGTCPRFPSAISKNAAHLIQQLLCVEPSKRISSVDRMKKHKFLRAINFETVYNRKVTPSFIPNRKQLNCDPTFELEEMIIEAKPLHKKKKRLSKKYKSKTTTQGNEDAEAKQKHLETIEENFIVYNRTNEMQRRKIEEKEKDWEEELEKIIN